MSANQKPDYRAAPVTQRDGSRLANSNCRMASIATGLDFDTLGTKKSTGAKMRAHQSDQEGGTDSGDAQRAWRDGYDENLDVQDGKVWADVLTDLQRFRYVHIDVWHKTVGGPCLSGTGAYGHTMVIAPDCVDGNWLVSDPWCNPPRWARVSEAKLKAGAEEWGRRVYGAATSGPGASDQPTLEQLRYIIKRLMSRYHPGDDGEEDPTEDPGDTGGPQRVMYTATTSHAPVTGGPMNSADLTYWQTANAKTGRQVRDRAGKPIHTTPATPTAYPLLATDVSEYVLRLPGDVVGWITKGDVGSISAPGPVGHPCPVCPEPPDVSQVVAEAVEARDGEWQEWLLEGSPGQRERSTMAAPSEE